MKAYDLRFSDWCSDVCSSNLSSDNAVVIALAYRSLPPNQKKWGIICGAGAAIVLRIIFAIFIVFLLTVPYLKIVGGILLFWVAVKLVLPEEGGEGEGIRSEEHTSELQSLMRISYAVFCLKKTQKHKDKRLSHVYILQHKTQQ